MKSWSILGLLALGLVAALCAAMLVASLQASSQDTALLDTVGLGPPAQVTLWTAARALPAMTIVELGDLEPKGPISETDAPADALTSDALIVGQVLITPMVEGQPFTKSCFADAGSGRRLAATLPGGRRAVSISLANHSALEGLLYPGSLVDVLVSVTLPDDQGRPGEAVSVTLLQGLEVLAINEQTVVSAERSQEKATPRESSSRRVMVTLMVDTQQAEALNLAIAHGTVSLALRNPIDRIASSDTGPGVSLGDLSEKLARHFAFVPPPVIEVTPPPQADEIAKPEPPPPEPGVEPPPTWDMVIIRGTMSETRSFPLPDRKDAEH
ncbi:MAG: Flp pilus assembly protein CpaB [Planctomycetota bacterium]